MATRATVASGADPAIGAKLRRVAVMGTAASRADRERVEGELDELEELARTLGTEVVDRRLFTLREPHPATFLRSGMVETLAAEVAELDRPAVLCNDTLSPRQQRNLQDAWGVPVLDRTEVILAIFAHRAITAEGRLQVEMAQLEHLLPRLAGGWSHLERQRGGVGLRGGPGETQIEVDRRLIRRRIKRLRERLVVLERQRRTRRTARTDVPLASCALVGYTNAGKSTLLNALTHSTVLADDLLFATLDPTSRRLELPSGRRVIVTDTVGFIQKLPTELVEAFAATLEEVRQAHMLAVVVDGSHPDCASQLKTVMDTLAEMGCDQPALLLVNKTDLLARGEQRQMRLTLGDVAGISPLEISARTGAGLRELRQSIDGLAGSIVADTKANRPMMSALPPADAEAPRSAAG